MLPRVSPCFLPRWISRTRCPLGSLLQFSNISTFRRLNARGCPLLNHGLQNNSVIPYGGQVVRRALVRGANNQVTEHRTYYHGGVFRTVSQQVDTVNRGVLLPSWKLPAYPGARRAWTTGLSTTGQPLTPTQIAVETSQQVQAATAPVGTRGALIAPLPAFARQGRLFGAPQKA